MLYLTNYFSILIDRIMKLSSPSINNVIVVSAILCYLSIIFLGMNTKTIGTNKSTLKAACWVSSLIVVNSFPYLPHKNEIFNISIV